MKKLSTVILLTLLLWLPALPSFSDEIDDAWLDELIEIFEMTYSEGDVPFTDAELDWLLSTVAYMQTLENSGGGASYACDCTCRIICPGGNVECPRTVFYPAGLDPNNPPTPGTTCRFPSSADAYCIGNCPGSTYPSKGQLINCVFSQIPQ